MSKRFHCFFHPISRRSFEQHCTGLGAVDFEALQEGTVQKASKYTKWADQNRVAVGKYASEHGNVAAVHHCKKDFPNIKESTRNKEAKKQNLQPLMIFNL